MIEADKWMKAIHENGELPPEGAVQLPDLDPVLFPLEKNELEYFDCIEIRYNGPRTLCGNVHNGKNGYDELAMFTHPKDRKLTTNEKLEACRMFQRGRQKRKEVHTESECDRAIELAILSLESELGIPPTYSSKEEKYEYMDAAQAMFKNAYPAGALAFRSDKLRHEKYIFR